VAAAIWLAGAWLGAAGAQAQKAAATAGAATDAQYRLSPGDRLNIVVFGQEDVSGEFQIDGAGNITMPLLGQVAAASRTVTQLQTEITAALDRDYIVNPRVSIEVLNYRPFYILGEVQKPGEYPYTSDLTVRKAVATANGFTYRANQKKVFIKHANSEKEESYPLDANTPVQPGDTIRIAERWF
jgi:protein involved in polysaccharide export with SLBB domain